MMLAKIVLYHFKQDQDRVALVTKENADSAALSVFGNHDEFVWPFQFGIARFPSVKRGEAIGEFSLIDDLTVAGASNVKAPPTPPHLRLSDEVFQPGKMPPAPLVDAESPRLAEPAKSQIDRQRDEVLAPDRNLHGDFRPVSASQWIHMNPKERKTYQEAKDAWAKKSAPDAQG